MPPRSLPAGVLSTSADNKADPDAVIAEITTVAQLRRYAIFRLVRNSEIRLQMIESSLDPDVSAYVAEVLADETSGLSTKACEARMPFCWSFGADPAVCRRAKVGAADVWTELAGSVFQVYFRCCSAAEKLVFIGQSAAGAEPLDRERLFYCHGLAQVLFDQFSLGSPIRGGVSMRVTARERECLRWCAEGKTSEEIGIILSLSTHTVNHYLISATKKLNAVNRMHAITIAIRHGLLDINDEP